MGWSIGNGWRSKEQIETLRRFLEQRPVVRGETAAADT
jgi:hypothetical protein